MNAQRFRALSIANDVRDRRSALRRDLASGELGAADVILGSWPCLDSARVGQVLGWVWSVGPYYAGRICLRAGVPSNRSMGELSTRERGALVAAIAEVRPKVVAA
jgi:hypothetical protein